MLIILLNKKSRVPAFRPAQREHGPPEPMGLSYSPQPSSRFQVNHSVRMNQPPLMIPKAQTFRLQSRTSPRLEHRPSERNGSFGKDQELTWRIPDSSSERVVDCSVVTVS